jgi:hypothetical protein
VHQLLHLLPDVGVLEMLLKRSRVLFCLLKDAVHNRVLQNAGDLNDELVFYAY